MITLKQDQLGRWSVPDLIKLDSSGQIILDRTILPQAAAQIVFGRGLALQHLENVITEMPAEALIVVGASSSKAPIIQTVLAHLRQFSAKTHIFQVQGRADHQAILSGIELLHKTKAQQMIVIGGGTTLDVGKAVAGLAAQEDGTEIAAFQRGERTINPEAALPWIAVPTTSGTGSESTNNAVIELGEEKRSIRNIPPPAMIIADPSFTDSLPLAATIIALVDALAQSLEVITNAAATPEIQALGIAAFLSLVQGLKTLLSAEEKTPENNKLSANTNHTGEQNITPTTEGAAISPPIRDTLSWGSLLMGIAFAHAGLALPHGLVHFCNKFGLAHGHMVGILLVPGLTTQAEHDPATALRLARIEEAFLSATQDKTITLRFEDETTAPANSGSSRLLAWLDQAIKKLLTKVNLATTLQQAGLSPADLDWIADQEYALGASFAIPKRRASREELRAVLHKAWSKHNLK